MFQLGAYVGLAPSHFEMLILDYIVRLAFDDYAQPFPEI